MQRRSKRKGQPEKENNERWLITYSDLITLLMIFFVIMYAMSKVDQVKFYALEQSLSEAMHHSKDISQTGIGRNSLLTSSGETDHNKLDDPSSQVQQIQQTQQAQQQAQANQQFNDLYQQIKQYIQQHNLQANVTIEDQARGIQITFKDVVLFDTGQAALKPHAKQILNGLIPFLQTVKNPVVVEGYTDDQPIDTPQYPSNWELSASRAVNVVRYLSSQKVDPTRLSGVGYGQYHPIVPNDNAIDRQKNRRVNIVIMRSLTTGTQPVESTPPTN